MDFIFVLSSITYAMKAGEILKEAGITSSLTRSAAIRKVRGCGYGLRVVRENRAKAEQHLKDAGIRVLGIVSDTK